MNKVYKTDENGTLKWETDVQHLIGTDEKPTGRKVWEIYYSKETGKVVKIIEEYVKNGRRSLQEFLQNIQVQYITQEEIEALDPEGRSFVNINTMEDLT